MSKNIIRIRFLSLNDAVEEPVPNVLLYLKKLTKVSTSDESRIQLEEKSPNSSVVLSWNEPYDLALDDEFFQLLFVESKDEPKVITDIIFYQHYLFDLLTCSIKNDDKQGEIFFYASLDQKRILKYSLKFVQNNVKVQKIHRKVPERLPIRGHLMMKHQFNEPVYCAICTKFIVGLRLQGYQCERCSLVTHKKCHGRIPFWCQKSLNPMPRHYTGNAVLEYHPAHLFKRYEPSFLPTITPCRNCGSQVSGNGLKCALCLFIIHQRCEMSIPPMCGISYKVRANALEINLIQIVNTTSPSNMPDGRNSQSSNTSSLDSIRTNTTDEPSTSNCSNSSSIDVRWLDPLPQGDLTDLPKFSDFECIGRLGCGQYSNVYCARHIPSTKYVAIKVIDGSIESARDQFEVERQLLFRYGQQNPFIIKAYCSFHQGCNLFLVMEFVGDDTLKEKIQKTRMNENDIRYYLAEIISVIQYLHSNKIVHRDLKLEHILVCSEGHIRLVDFGLGRILNTDDEVCHTVCGTDTYMSPEIRRLEKDRFADGYSYPVDFWAIGIMLVQLLCGEQMDFYDEATDLSSLAEDLLSDRHISAEALSLVRGLLEIDPKKRLGPANSPYGSIRDHPFFKVGKEMDWDEVDDGVLKSIHKRQTLIRTNSDLSISLPISSLDRGTYFNREWTKAGQSECTPHDEEQYKSFDYINRSMWSKFNQKNE